MEIKRPSPETMIKLLPIIAPLANTPQVINAVSNGKYVDAVLGTAFGAGIGTVARIAILREYGKQQNIQTEDSKISLLEGQELTIPSEDLQYGELDLSLPDSQTSFHQELELRQ